ncbi:MAG TPA: PIN domain-containing protein [Gemmatimonadaceae bacterium]|nr:PIN domain-containing protein [Gemmatimonadaceae bacterium]
MADTGAVIALIDKSDAHHDDLVALFDDDPGAWVLPWAILPEVDYLLATHVSVAAQRAFLRDLGAGAFNVEWGDADDLERAQVLCEKHASLKLGLVDASVIAVAERLRARAIATLDLRDFGAVKIAGSPKLIPRDS